MAAGFSVTRSSSFPAILRLFLAIDSIDAVVEKFDKWKNGTYVSGNEDAVPANSGFTSYGGGGFNLSYMENISTYSSSTTIQT